MSRVPAGWQAEPPVAVHQSRAAFLRARVTWNVLEAGVPIFAADSASALRFQESSFAHNRLPSRRSPMHVQAAEGAQVRSRCAHA